MKLFKTSQGFVISFGFDMTERKPSPHVIAWCDPQTSEWETKATNTAGYNVMPFDVEPEFVHEIGRGKVVAYQPGKLIEMTFVGGPFIWTFNVLQPEQSGRIAA